MIKIFTATCFLLLTVINLTCTAADDEVISGHIGGSVPSSIKTPGFIRYHKLGLRYLEFMNDVSTLNEEDIRSGISTLFADEFLKICNTKDLLSKDCSAPEALLRQFMDVRRTLGTWKFREESFICMPSPEVRTTIVHFIFDTFDINGGRSFNTMAFLEFDADEKISKITETFAPIPAIIPAMR